MNRAIEYARLGFETVQRTQEDWEESVPTSIPNLPNCKTDRLASELCAIYYIITYTILAGPIGSLIMPAAQIAVDLFIIFEFVRGVMAIIKRLDDILEV